MEKDLHKSLEEAAEDYIERNYKDSITPDWNEKDFIAGAEWMFKEAIEVAKEWLETNIANQVEMMCAEGPLMMSKKAFLADFESGMLKLWEEQK